MEVVPVPMADSLSIGTSALLSLQQALKTTSQNIANVGTDGYSRQIAQFNTLPPEYSGGNYIGTGVRVTSIERAYDQFLVDQVMNRASSLAYYQTYADMSARVDDLFANSTTGLSNALQGFFDAVQAVSANPGSATERELLLASAQELASRFNQLDQSLANFGRESAERTTQVVGEVNDLAQRLAKVNNEIARTFAASGGATANDLLDERDRLLNALSEKIGISVNEQANGTVDVTIGTGQPLVIAGEAQTLVLSASVSTPGQLEIGITGVNGTVASLSNLIQGGELQGLVDFSTRVVDSAKNALGRIALSITETFNAQHRLGMDLNNLMGQDFFGGLTPTIVAGANNAGGATASVTVDDVTALEASDYRLRYDGAQWILTRTSDNTQVVGAGPFTLDGITINIAGAPAVGDSFLVRPVNDAAGQMSVALIDASQIAAAAPVRSNLSLTNTGTAVISDLAVSDSAGLPLVTPIVLTYNPDAFGPGVPGYDVAGGPAGPLDYDPATDSGGKTFTFPGFGDIGFTLSGTPGAGDTISIQSNIGASGDNRNALLLGGLQNQPLFEGGTANYAELYGQLLGEVGTLTRQAQTGVQTESLLMDRAVSARDSVSGVNLEEEAANLLRFQQAYQAAAQMIAAADELFQTLLNATRR